MRVRDSENGLGERSGFADMALAGGRGFRFASELAQEPTGSRVPTDGVFGA